MEYTLHNDFSELNAQEWNDLLKESVSDTPFLRHEYQRGWWEHRGGGEWQNAQLILISAREDGKLIGIAPLFIAEYEGKNALLLIGSIEISDYLDVIVRMGISMVPEGRRVFPLMSVRDNLLMGAFTRTDKAEIRQSLEMVLARFPRLKERYTQAAGTMSGGEQQMLVIGRALMARPRLLLLDEPSLGIAPKLVQDIARSIVAINREDKVSVLLVEQNSRMALRISQRAYAIATGKVALSGNSAELLEDSRVKDLYLGGEV